MWDRERIESEIKDNDIVVFGRGNMEIAGDGHTKRAIEILDAYGLQYKLVDISANSILEAIVQVSGWTIPQIFIAGELVGGSDALLELHQNGKLPSLLKHTKIR